MTDEELAQLLVETNPYDVLARGQMPPGPVGGMARAGGLLMRGATFGLAGAQRPAETLGESALEMAGSVPTIAGVSAAVSPAVAVALRALKVPAVALPVASRIAGATATGGIVGGVEAGVQGEPVLPGAARGAGTFAAIESGLMIPRILRGVRAAGKGAQGATTGATQAPGERKALPLPRVARPMPGQLALPPGPEAPKALPAGEVFTGPETYPARSGPGRVGPQPALPTRQVTWEHEIVPETPSVEPREFATPASAGEGGVEQVFTKAADGTLTPNSPEIMKAVEAAAEMPPPVTVPEPPRLPSARRGIRLTKAHERQYPGLRERISQDPLVDIHATRELTLPPSVERMSEDAAEAAVNTATSPTDVFTVQTLPRGHPEYSQRGGIDIGSTIETPRVTTFLDRFKDIGKELRGAYETMSAGETMKRMGFLWNLRTQRGAFGDEFTVRVLNPLALTHMKGVNTKATWFDRFYDATKGIKIGRWTRAFRGLPEEQDRRLNDILRLVDGDGRYTGPVATYTPEEITAAQKLRGAYNDLFEEAQKAGAALSPDRYLNFYAPNVRARPTGIIREANPTREEAAFIRSMDPAEARFVHELERTGTMQDIEPRASTQFAAYVNALVNAKVMRPFYENVEKDFVDPYFAKRFVKDTATGKTVALVNDAVGYNAWQELKHHMYGGLTNTDVNMSYSLKKLAGYFGHEVDDHAMHKIVGGIQSAYYAGAMGSFIGGRPASIVRQLSQLVPTFAELGAKYTMTGIRESFNTAHIQRLRDMGIFQSPIEHLLGRVVMARGTDRALSKTSETMLKLFSATDQWLRGVTAMGAEARFNDYLARNALEKLPAGKEIKTELLRLVRAGNVEEARAQYMIHNVATMQYIYGPANRPHVMRGALGNLLGMFMSYPLNTMEMYRAFGKRAMEGDPMPLVRLIGIASALMMGGSQFANADLSSAFFLGSIPSSLTFPKIGADIFTAGRTNVEALTKNMFLVGETDYHKQQRAEAVRQAGKDLRAFMPGGVFLFEDLPKVADTRTLGSLFALTPKADVLNQLARERAQERAVERHMNVPAVGGVKAIK